MQKRVYICGLHQESNSFNPVCATYEDFQVSTGEETVNENGKVNVRVKGMLKGLKAQGITPLGGWILSAGSGGPVQNSVVENFIQAVLQDLEKLGKVDGILMEMHGATVSETSQDVCGDIFEAVRNFVGEDMPISASFDLHANITEKILRNVDFISGYQMYPHLDMFETGYRAAERLVERLQGKSQVTVRVALPQIAPAHAYTTSSGNLLKLMDKAKGYKESGEIIDYNVFQVQPWLDVKNIASTVVICAETEEVAKRVATELAKEEFALRKELLGSPLYTVEEVVQKALYNASGKPIVLVDSADSPNAGACGDSAYALEFILPYKDTLRAAVGITDPKGVEQAFSVGVGNTATFTLGASIAPKLSKPIVVTATVKSLHDGNFYRYGPQERGVQVALGRTAVLQIGKTVVHLVSQGGHGDLGFYRSFGTEPAFFDLVCVKACTSFRAGYAEIAQEICNANTCGAAGCTLTQLPYENLPKPLYPFEEIAEKDITTAKRYR